jgi:hypothetical protein
MGIALCGLAVLGSATAQGPPRIFPPGHYYPPPRSYPDQPEELARTWYQNYFRRDPDPREVRWVADQLRRGETPESVLSMLLAGRDFYDYCGGTDAGFVTQLIGDIGHHEAKGQEVSYYYRRLQTESRRDLVYSMLLRYPQNWEPGLQDRGPDDYDYRGPDWRYRR